MTPPELDEHERTSILEALRAGTVPRTGLQYLQVGREDEIETIRSDLEHVAEGGSGIRFVVGPYGSGKSFLLRLASSMAYRKEFVVASCDLAMSRRLYGSNDEGRHLYRELTSQLATASHPGGHALESVVERWWDTVLATRNNTDDTDVRSQLESSLSALRHLPRGDDFVSVLVQYAEGKIEDDPERCRRALRWLRGGYSTKTEARQALGVRSIVDDAHVYDHVKLLARFVRLAGYEGLVVALDEMKVLSHNLSHLRSRESNYEVILQILNDSLEDEATGLQWLMGGIPEFLEDATRGLYSYGALETRLSPSSWGLDALPASSGPVLRLDRLEREQFQELLARIRDLATPPGASRIIPDAGIRAFTTHCAETMGAEHFQTPRNTIKAFVALLQQLRQCDEASWREMLPTAEVPPPSPATADSKASEDDIDAHEHPLTSFQL